MISTYDAYTLALYSYFDLFDETLPLSLKDFKEHLFSEAYMNQQRSDLFTLMNLELAKTLDIESLGSFPSHKPSMKTIAAVYVQPSLKMIQHWFSPYVAVRI